MDEMDDYCGAVRKAGTLMPVMTCTFGQGHRKIKANTEGEIVEIPTWIKNPEFAQGLYDHGNEFTLWNDPLCLSPSPAGSSLPHCTFPEGHGPIIIEPYDTGETTITPFDGRFIPKTDSHIIEAPEEYEGKTFLHGNRDLAWTDALPNALPSASQSSSKRPTGTKWTPSVVTKTPEPPEEFFRRPDKCLQIYPGPEAPYAKITAPQSIEPVWCTRTIDHAGWHMHRSKGRAALRWSNDTVSATKAPEPTKVPEIPTVTTPTDPHDIERVITATLYRTKHRLTQCQATSQDKALRCTLIHAHTGPHYVCPPQHLVDPERDATVKFTKTSEINGQGTPTAGQWIEILKQIPEDAQPRITITDSQRDGTYWKATWSEKP